MRKLVYYVATSIDGFIARQDGSFDFVLKEGSHLAGLFDDFPETVPGPMREALGVSGPNRCFDVVLMGKNTYQVGLDAGILSPYVTLEQYVISSSMTASKRPSCGSRSGFLMNNPTIPHIAGRFLRLPCSTPSQRWQRFLQVYQL